MLRAFHELMRLLRDLHKDAADAKTRINTLQREVHELTLLVQALQKQ